MTDLATEVARAMSGRPAWRVAAACIKGVACPRCDAEQGVRCKGKATCRERVWRQRAKERADKGPALGGVAGFLDELLRTDAQQAGSIIWTGDGTWVPATSDASLASAINGGLVRLTTIKHVVPSWALTEAGAAYAEEWARMREGAKPSAQPAAPPVDAAAATQAFMERAK